MKKPCKKIKLLALILVITAVVSAFTACIESPKGGGEITIRIGGDTYSLVTEKSTLGEALDELTERENLRFECRGIKSDRFIEELGSLKPSPNEYIAIYSTSDDMLLSDMLKPSITEDGVTYYYAGLGIDSFPALDGLIFYFTVKTM